MLRPFSCTFPAIRAGCPAPRGFLHHQLPGLLWALLQGREVVALPHCWSWKPLLVLLWVPGSHFLPQILDEVEKRRQISMAVIYPFMQGLRESPFPAPGKTVTIKSFIPDSGTEVGAGLGGARACLGAPSTPAAPRGAHHSRAGWARLPGASSLGS